MYKCTGPMMETYEQLLRLPDVLTMCGLGRSKLYAMIAEGEFPKPVHLGRASAWPVSELQAWIEARKAARS